MKRQNKRNMKIWHFAVLFALFFAKFSHFKEYKAYTFDFLVALNPYYKNILEFVSTFIVYLAIFYLMYFMYVVIKNMILDLFKKQEINKFKKQLNKESNRTFIRKYFADLISEIKWYFKGFYLLVNYKKYTANNVVVNYNMDHFLVVNFILANILIFVIF